MEKITITLPDSSTRDFAAGVTIRQVAESIGERLGRETIGGVVDSDGTILDANTSLRASCALRLVTLRSEQGLAVLRHSVAHLMAAAVQKLFPGTQVAIGPAIEDGFYYDFDKHGGFTPDDLEAIEAEMQRLAAADAAFVREEIDRDEARQRFAALGEKYKVELVDAIAAGATVTLYRTGEWFDLCRGPHIPSTKYVKAFKLTHVAGAYWRGDERNPMLARIYGTAFWEKKALAEYLQMLEEAKKRDHRKVGRQLDLFSFNPIAPAMPFFHPKGAFLYNRLTEFVRNYYQRIGFSEVITPQIVDVELFKRSGHYANYKENMFFCQVDEREFGVKPMNCPGHTLIYATEKRSYRDLPIRYADFGRLHRYERSGVTAGLTRVRSFAQDDAHIFCREDQIQDEIASQIMMIRDVYGHFGFETRVAFSTRPAKSMGREDELADAERAEWDAIWARAEASLESALKAAALAYQLNAGDGAFYGPKIDCEVRDALGRWHQLGTIQLDFSMPKRFELSYTNAEGGSSRPVMIHRAVLGSLERFIGILIEHCAGDFPLWLAPVQVRIVTINDELLDYGREVAEILDSRGIRVALDTRSEKLGFKIRDAEVHKIPVVIVLGEKEREQRAVSVRWRKKGDLGTHALDQAIQLVLDAAATPGPGKALQGRVEKAFGL